MRRIVIGLVVGAAVLLVVSRHRTALAQSAYTVSGFSLTGTTTPYVAGLSNRGTLIGALDLAYPDYGAFMFKDGVKIELGTFGGVGSGAHSINVHDDITGFAVDPNGQTVPFVYHAGVMSPIPVNLASPSSAYGVGINDSGQVLVAGFEGMGSVQRSFLYTNGALLPLDPFRPGAVVQPRALNNAGDVIGSVYPPNQAFVYRNGAIVVLGTLGGAYSSARALSDTGYVIGEADTSNGYSHAFRYRDGVMTDLGTLGGGLVSAAQAVNDAGQVIGYSVTS